ncbi:MAG: LPS export ABC transporter ATP-binding protein [Athalassotoga sp.]|uniref:LPS export ABC transporter ATP-binding protein n=1 Tax=Athalassotoga sp. TaxID=2022597 RepID=UPI003D00FB06
MSKLLCYKLRKKFGKKLAVDDVSLSIDSGQVVGILGPNGAGKTTVFNMILGLTIPDSGHIFKDAVEITNMPVYLRARNGITYLAQEPSIFAGLSVEDNLRLVLENFNHSKKEIDVRIKYLLTRFGLISMSRQRADSLSGGEKRRLEIARMMTLSPAFLLLDEPFGGIDPMTVKEIQKIIRELKENGLGIIITDHSVERIVEIVDELYVIHKGKILSHGLPEDVLRDERVVRNFLGS